MSVLLLIGWLAVAVVLIWPLATHIAHDHAWGKPTTDDWIFALALASMFALLWPVALGPAASWLLWRQINRNVEPQREEVDR